MKKKNPRVLKAIKYIELAVLALSLSAFAPQSETALTERNEKAKTEYTLSVYDGRVAVFENGEAKPVEVFDVYITSLPYNEQIKLLDGLTVSDRSELQQLIEDYTS